jgi:DNA polymerase-3 subunit delta'
MSVLHPREQHAWFGHGKAEAQLLQAASSGRLPHAWLIHGPRGVGKATLAYRFAKFLLAGGAESAAQGGGFFGGPEDLGMPADAPTSRRVVAGTHADLLVLESESTERKRQEISVEEAREVAHFLAHTPSEANWRVVVVDSADALNPAAANALLKLIEEPPPQAMMLLVAHQIGRVLPTIRSRCRQLELLIPEAQECDQILQHIAPDMDFAERDNYRLLAGGAPGMAVQLKHLGAERALEELFANLPKMQGREGMVATIAYVDGLLSGDDGSRWELFGQYIRRTVQLASKLHADPDYARTEMLPVEQRILPELALAKPLDSWLGLWDNAQKLLSDTERLNLDRKQTAIQLLQAVAA